MIRGAAAAALVASLAACADARSDTGARPITNGEIDEGDLAVVALLRGGAPFCSGTLISPTVVLTAAHCIELGPDAVYIGSDPAADPGIVLPVADVRVHPSYDRALRHADIAVMLLRAAAPDGVPTALLSDAPLDASAVGSPIRLVGFGWTTNSAEPMRKRQGVATVAEVAGTWFRFVPSPSQTCHGDSGGPAFRFVDGREHLVGVTSGGDRMCAGYGIDIDVAAFLDDFVRPYLAATAPGAAGLGERCFVPASCREGDCAPAEAAGGHAYCSIACTGDADCPPFLRCATGVEGAWCRHPPPGPGAIGAPCAAPWDCVSGVCAGDFGDEPVCATACAWDGDCAAGETCRAWEPGGPRVCVLVEASGGACASAPHPELLAAIVWLLLVIHPGRWLRRGTAPMPTRTSTRPRSAR